MTGPAVIDTVVLDLDGTLVDSVYVHTLAWQAALADVGLTVPAHRIHRAIGMGGDRLVAYVAGEAVESSLGDELRSRHPRHLDRLFDAIKPTEGAVQLLEALRSHDLQVVLASSSEAELTDRLLDVIEGARPLLSRVITGADAESSKPSGQLIEVALGSLNAGSAVVVGDAVWDVLAARDAGTPCLSVLTGGISTAELTGAGAVAVHEHPRALAEHLDREGSLLPDTRRGDACDAC